VIEDRSSEATKLSSPLLAVPLIAMGPLKVTPGAGSGVGVWLGIGVGSIVFVGVGGMEVCVGGMRVAVGGTDVAIGTGVDGGLHPNSRKKAHPIPKALLSRLLRFIWRSSFSHLLADSKRVQ
jgi:hypothetical protein